MEFKVNRKALSSALTIAQSCVETKGTIPILGFALLERKGDKVEITATDLDLTFTTEIDAEGDAFATCLPARQLAQLVALFEGQDVSFTRKENTGRVQVACGKSKYLLPCSEREQFPNVEKVDGKEFFIKGAMLKTMLERTVFAASSEASRHALQGVYLETKEGNLIAVATDGFRLAQVKYPVPFSEKVSAIVPRRAVQAILKAVNEDDPVIVRFGENSIRVTQNFTAISARTVVGKFPNYEMIIPKTRNHVFTFPAGAASVFKRIALTANFGAANDSPEVVLDVSKTGVDISAADGKKGEGFDHLETQCETLNGDTIRLGLASSLVLEMMAREPELSFGFNDNKNSFLIQPTGLREYEYVGVTMSVRVD